jgi:hypothetical protein
MISTSPHTGVTVRSRTRRFGIVVVGCVALVLAMGSPAVATGNTVKGIGLDYGDPGSAEFDGTYYVYGTSRGGGFPVASSPRYNGTYTDRGAILKRPPGWVGSAPTLGKRMWAPEVFRVNANYQWEYVLYYTAWDAKQGRNCIGIADSAYPTHGSGRVGGPICAPPGEPSNAEAIDPTYFISDAGKRFLIFKTSVANTSRWKIWALPMDGLGLHPTGALPRVKLAPDHIMESPSIVNHNGTVWLFVSRNWYNQCNYLTEAWSAGSLWGGTFTFRRSVLNPSTTGLACGNGGASVANLSGSTRTVFFSHGSALSNTRRDRVATIKWDSRGIPFVA